MANTINTEKSKVMVFRKGRWYLGRSGKWFIDRNILELVNRYLYLGFTFTTTMNANEAAMQLAVRGKKPSLTSREPATSWAKCLDKPLLRYLTP